MSQTAQEVAQWIDMLPDEDQRFAREVVRKLMLAWDPDFTRLTAQERERLEMARREEHEALDLTQRENTAPSA